MSNLIKSNMKLSWVILFLLVTGNLTFAQESGTEKQAFRAPVGAFDVSLVKLIATPEEYHGKTVRVIGYLNLKFEGDAIFLHREDFENGLTRNGFWVDVPQGDGYQKMRKSHSRKYVMMVGTFDMNSRGHFGLFAGGFKNITRLDIWPIIRNRE